MDNHHKSHYGIAGAIVAAGVGAGSFMWHQVLEKGPQWPAIDAATATRIVTEVAAAIPDHKFTIYCGDSACVKISKQLLAAGKAAKLDVKPHGQAWGAGDNLFVGAPNDDDAQKIANTINGASGGALKVDHVATPQPDYYIAFGRLNPAD